MPRNLQAWAGELVGTFMFVTIGAGAGDHRRKRARRSSVCWEWQLAHALRTRRDDHDVRGHLREPLQPGGHVVGVDRTQDLVADALGYVAGQILGALGAGLPPRGVRGGAWRRRTLAPRRSRLDRTRRADRGRPHVLPRRWSIWGTGIDDRGPRVGGFAIGRCSVAVILAFGPLTGVGASTRRAISARPRSPDNLDDWWVYFVGPAIGGAVAGVALPDPLLGRLPVVARGRKHRHRRRLRRRRQRDAQTELRAQEAQASERRTTPANVRR